METPPAVSGEEIQMRKVAAYLFGFGGRKSLVDATKAESKL
jgi:hypothetical protein